MSTKFHSSGWVWSKDSRRTTTTFWDWRVAKMNELIKKIIERADITFDKDIEDIDVCVLLPSDLEKFAELIVLECIVTIQLGISRDGNNTEKYLRSMKHIKEIKEHFGIYE